MVTSTGIESSKILKAAGVELLAYFCESLRFHLSSRTALGYPDQNTAQHIPSVREWSRSVSGAISWPAMPPRCGRLPRRLALRREYDLLTLVCNIVADDGEPGKNSVGLPRFEIRSPELARRFRRLTPH
jgi:hypothetical protein